MIQVLLLALAFLGSPAVGAAPQLVLDARVIWSDPSPEFGGFSGIEVGDGGAGFVAIGDRGSWAEGRMIREDGRLQRVETSGFGSLHGIDGDRLASADSDAEGFAVDAAGRFFVSFEAFHRVRRYDDVNGPAAKVPGLPAFKRLQDNSGLEALAIDAGGALYAIPERSGRWERPFPVYRLEDGAWSDALSLSRSGKFLVAGADFGPDGRLYIVERDFGWLTGFATRIRRFTLGPDGFDAGETLLETASGSTDNFEGISVWADADGETRITLIADDNFFPLQSTVIAEYRLTAG
jgi:hypothetical protein